MTVYLWTKSRYSLKTSFITKEYDPERDKEYDSEMDKEYDPERDSLE